MGKDRHFFQNAIYSKYGKCLILRTFQKAISGRADISESDIPPPSR
jgi:hypothetical protein